MEQTNVHSKKDVICRVMKQLDNSYHQGSFYHPMMWNSPDHKMTLSFSTYDWEYTLGNNTTSPYKPVYLQMVFLVYGDNNKYCSVRVQQYLIDPLKSINNSCSWNFQHCGKYDCSEAKILLESIGFVTYEVDEREYERRKHNNDSIDSKGESLETTPMSGNENIDDGRGQGTLLPRSDSTEENDRSISSLHEYDLFPPKGGVIYYYNSSNSVMNSFHSYAVTSIILVPLVVLIVAVLAIRCYISRSRNGYRTYESHESLIVPLNHPLIMNTHVSEDGNVILGEVLPSNRFWARDYSMDYIQPVDLRSIHRSLGGSKTTISAPPSYETLGPPRYSDAVVI
ncbi:unnamed protein product [Allacma fusca]|uniref:Uncharacterized protein n=1 Tax=Allacma fusca TaxID=39272 RepID=A0A8J2KUQ4_9HEXA|nr:unnamed protein product [Allacma fusca]